MTPAELKKELRDRGFLVYRTLPDGIALAEYERENLLVDAGVRVSLVPALGVTTRFRVEQHAFPGESDEQLYGRARALAAESGLEGLVELGADCIPQTSPSDPHRVMDIFYDVVFFAAADSLDAVVRLAKQATQTRRSLGG